MAIQAIAPLFYIPFEKLEQTFTYSGGFISSITSEYEDVTYVQTFTNDGTYITNITKWVAQ